jgi:hypothetical protein
MKRILKWFGYIKIDYAKSWAYEIAMAQNRAVQAYAKRDFGVNANQNCASEMREFVDAAFVSFLERNLASEILLTPLDTEQSND